MNIDPISQCAICGVFHSLSDFHDCTSTTTGEWTADRIVKFLGLHSKHTEACSFLAHAINAALAAEKEKAEQAGWANIRTNEMLTAVRRERDEAQQQLAAEQDKYRISLAVNKDDCETDTNVRNLARPILGDFKVDGDSYGVPTLESITEELIKQLAAKDEQHAIATKLAAERLADNHKQQLAAEQEKVEALQRQLTGDREKWQVAVDELAVEREQRELAGKEYVTYIAGLQRGADSLREQLAAAMEALTDARKMIDPARWDTSGIDAALAKIGRI